MALHPQARAALAEDADGPEVWEPGFDIEGMRREARDAAAGERGPQIAEVRDVDADGVRCRLYRGVAHRAGHRDDRRVPALPPPLSPRRLVTT